MMICPELLPFGFRLFGFVFFRKHWVLHPLYARAPHYKGDSKKEANIGTRNQSNSLGEGTRRTIGTKELEEWMRRQNTEDRRQETEYRRQETGEEKEDDSHRHPTA